MRLTPGPYLLRGRGSSILQGAVSLALEQWKEQSEAEEARDGVGAPTEGSQNSVQAAPSYDKNLKCVIWLDLVKSPITKSLQSTEDKESLRTVMTCLSTPAS